MAKEINGKIKIREPCRKMKFQGISHALSSFGFVEIDSLCGLCFFHLFLVKAIIQEGTSQPEAVMTFAMFRKYGMSSSV